MKQITNNTSIQNDQTSKPPPQPTSSIKSYFVQGSIAALTGKTVTAPLDRLKILIQTQQPNFSEVGAFKKNENGIINAIKRIIKADGYLGLYRGNHIALIRHGLHGGIGFTIHDTLHQRFNSNGNTTISKNFIIGACCGVGATFVTFPFETMRVMIATNQGNLRQLAISHGGYLKLLIRGYSGLSAGIIGVIPYAGLNFGLRDVMKDLLYQNKLRFGNTRTNCFDERGMPGWKTSFTLGVFSGLITQALVYPVEVVKRRRQNEVKRRYHSIVKELTKSGLRSTYAGLSLNIIRHPICNGIVWGVRDFIKRNQLI